MIQPHSHHPHHAPVAAGTHRVFALGIVLNLGFVAIEGYYGWTINSLSLLADAGHNLSDVATLLLSWFALLMGSRAPSAHHTYGWQRASVLAAFCNALLLLGAMAALAWEAILHLQSAAPTEGVTMMAVAACGVVINGVTAALLFRSHIDDLNMRSAFLHMAADAGISLGVVLAGALYVMLGWVWLDPVVSLLIISVIVVSSGKLLRQSLHLLFDGVPEHIDPQAVRAWLLNQPGVADVHDLHIWAMGTTEVALTAHLIMPAGHPGDQFLQSTAEALQQRFNIVHPTLQIEIAPVTAACSHHD